MAGTSPAMTTFDNLKALPYRSRLAFDIDGYGPYPICANCPDHP